jgi:Ca-activated chloride channel family protein
MRPWGVEFAHPWLALLVLVALPALWWSHRSTGRVVFSSLRVLPDGGGTWRTALAWLPDAMIVCAVVSLAIGLTGPRKGDPDSRVRREGISIMMAVDVSGSMRALDLQDKSSDKDITRLDAVKNVFDKFVQGRKDDAIGLVAFANYADTKSPLTLDHTNLIAAAKRLTFAKREDDGTAIGKGLELAVQRLTDAKTRSKVAILLTDGESNNHEIDEQTAIDDAKKNDIKVYTIGAGTNGVAPIRNARGDLMPMEVSIDEAMLRKIADGTGGRYFRATDASSLRAIWNQIDKLERSAIEDDSFTSYFQYYVYFVLVAMGLVIGALALRSTLLRRLP